jgi:dihydropteroate synthase
MDRILTMGVINITPNSFSDGNRFNRLESFQAHFKKIQSWSNIIDIGAESTAPFNGSISSYDELERFEDILFPFVANNPDPIAQISIDTYKPEVFYEVLLVLNKFWPKTRLIFNDVSGCIDDEVIDLLSMDLDFDYVLCHNLCPSRDLTSLHMNYLDPIGEKHAFNSMIQKLKNDLALIKPLGRNVIVDPCFGFSKTREQNLYLLKNINLFCREFKDYRLLFGFSRKSFLRIPRNLDTRDRDNQILLDQMQSILIYNLIKRNSDQFIFRVHEVHSVKSAINIASLLDN